MTDTVNVGSAANAGDGDPLLSAFQKINAKITLLDSAAPITVSGLTPPTLTGSTVQERTAYNTTVGTFSTLAVGESRRILDTTQKFILASDGLTLKTGRGIISYTAGTTINLLLEATRTVGSEAGGNLTYERIVTNFPITVTALSVTPTGLAPNVHVRSLAYGTADGSSWANAKAYSTIAAIIATTAPGHRIGIRADEGDIPAGSTQLITVCGGTLANPIEVYGCDVNYAPLHAKIKGSRFDWILPSDPETVSAVGGLATGGTSYRLQPGASNIRFHHLKFQQVSCAFDLAGNFEGLNNVVFEDLLFYNIRYFIDHSNGSGEGGAKTMNNISFNRIYGIGHAKAAFRVRGGQNKALVLGDPDIYTPAQGAYNFSYTDIIINSGRQDGDTFATGFVVDGCAHDITFLRCESYNVHDSQGGDNSKYWNGDGFAGETQNYNITSTNCISLGHCDAGVDFKSVNTLFTDCIYGSNKRGIKLWGGPHKIVRPIFASDPLKRGGSGGPVNFDLESANTGSSAQFPPTPNQTMIIGPANISATDPIINKSITYGDTNTVGAILRMVNITENNPPTISYSNLGPVQIAKIRIMRATTAPTGAITLGTLNSVANTGSAVISFTSNRDTTYNGVFVKSISGTHAAYFALNGFLQSIIGIGLSTGTYNITLLVEDIAGIQTSIPRTVTVQSVASAYIGALTTAGATPTAAEQTRLNTLFGTLSSSGIYAKLDRLFLLAGETEIQALMNVTDTSKSLSKSGTLTFTANLGYKGGALGYLYDPIDLTALGKMTSSSMFVTAYINAAIGTSGALIGTTGTSSRFRYASNTTTTTTNLYDSTGGQMAPAQTVRTGSYSMVRTDDGLTLGNKRIFRDSVLVATFDNVFSSTADGLPSILRNDTSYGSDQVAYYATGAQLTDAEVITFRDAMVTYLTNKGAN